MKKLILGSVILIVLVSCSQGGSKKVLIMSKGKATVDQAAKTVTVEGGTSHEEQTVNFSGDGALSLSVKANGNDMTVDIPSDGYYVLNAKKDTIIGVKQNYGTPAGETKTITQETLKHSIDSLQHLLSGNTTENNTFYILPGKAAKITANQEAIFVGPFNSMTSLEQTGDKAPEVYKFYTSKDIRENMARLEKMTVAAPSPNQ